jgi:eukaryotic-like serine/threonine-protein kinase
MKLADLCKGVQLGGKFRLVEILGRGSYGDVWQADVLSDDPDLPSKVALKIYHQQERADEALFKEAKNARSFVNERLVRVFGVRRMDGLVVMWMEYVPGQTLLKELGEEDSPKPVALEKVLRWLTNIADGLAYLHHQSPPCVHGDLKLDNILVDPSGGARLTDFGQSRTVENQYVTTQGAGGILYLAPEVFGENDRSGSRWVQSDIYAFGVVAYRILCGRFPQRNFQEVINRIPYPHPRDLNCAVPEALDAIIWKCLAKRPEDRYRTGAELLAALGQAADVIRKAKFIRIEHLPTRRELVVTPVEELVVAAAEQMRQGKEQAVAEELEKAIHHMSTAPKVLLIYAAAARKVGKLEIARAVYLRLISWMEANGWSDKDQVEAYEGLGDVSVLMKRYEEAMNAFEWLCERDPDKRWYSYRLGVALGLAGHYRRSITILEHLNQDEPRPLLCAKIGLAYYQDLQVEQACQYFNEALMLDACEPTALQYLAEIRAAQGRIDKAHNYLARLRQIEGAASAVARLERLLTGKPTR